MKLHPIKIAEWSPHTTLKKYTFVALLGCLVLALALNLYVVELKLSLPKIVDAPVETNIEKSLGLCLEKNPYLAAIEERTSPKVNSSQKDVLVNIQRNVRNWTNYFDELTLQIKQYSQGQHNHKRFDAFLPFAQCRESSRACVGGSCRQDTSKITCGLETLHSPCTIYSIGGNNQWDFEQDLYRKTPCAIYTFDCTGERSRFTPPDLDRLHFHHLCLSDQDAPPPKVPKSVVKSVVGEMLTLQSIQKRFGHSDLSLLKMDIEGYEFPVLENWFRAWKEQHPVALPMQILVEVHYRTQMIDLFEKRKQDWKSEEDLMDFSKKMMQLGYIVVERDDNKRCTHCTELTLLRYNNC